MLEYVVFIKLYMVTCFLFMNINFNIGDIFYTSILLHMLYIQALLFIFIKRLNSSKSFSFNIPF